MRTNHPLLAVLLMCLGACASTKHSTGPGSAPGTVLHRVDELSFEVVGDGWREGKGTENLGLTYCTSDPATKTCVLLAVWLSDNFESDCGNGTAVSEWLYQGRSEPAPLSITVADHPAWRFSKSADHLLVVCNGKRSWIVRVRAFGANQDRFAAVAFDIILATLKLDPAFTPKS